MARAPSVGKKTIRLRARVAGVTAVPDAMRFQPVKLEDQKLTSTARATVPTTINTTYCRNWPVSAVRRLSPKPNVRRAVQLTSPSTR